jgi:hypothetical protein
VVGENTQTTEEVQQLIVEKEIVRAYRMADLRLIVDESRASSERGQSPRLLGVQIGLKDYPSTGLSVLLIWGTKDRCK